MADYSCGDIGETISMFISNHYANRCPPKLILSPTPIFNGVEEWLQTRKNSLVEVRTPSRGDLVTLMQLAAQNAEIQLIDLLEKLRLIRKEVGGRWCCGTKHV